ncbi:hypothetical protein [Aeromonas encheleia]
MTTNAPIKRLLIANRGEDNRSAHHQDRLPLPRSGTYKEQK